jgi:hypothetical protein
MPADEVAIWLDQWRPQPLPDGEPEASTSRPVLH